jgi:2-polyprenyl-3-methyl-5-hydroxy-6-metoxy-1,4-benzoquinol methylase
MRKIFVNAYNFFGKLYLEPLLRLEQRKRPFQTINERPVEYTFAFTCLQRLCTGKILDIGSGQSSWPHLLSNCGYQITAIDKIDLYWSHYFNRHYKILKDDIVQPQLQDKFQVATCLSVLEHIKDHQMAVRNVHQLLEKDGYLILTFPYNEHHYHGDIYKHPAARVEQQANFITQVYSRAQINEWLTQTSFKIIEQTYYKVFSGELWAFGDRLIPSIQVEKTHLHHLTCLLLQKTRD